MLKNFNEKIYQRMLKNFNKKNYHFSCYFFLKLFCRFKTFL